MIITIDGPAGVGKTTVGKLTAKKLHFGFLDTGIMYRALTWFLLNNNLENVSQKKITNHINNLNFDLNIKNLKTTNIWIDKVNVTKLLNTSQIEKHVSKISSYQEIRKVMVLKQQDIVKNISSIVVGRDIGTIVLPNAELKFYLTASPKVRAKRRFSQISKKIPYEQVLADIIERDKLDMSRKFAPLKVPQNAIIIDTEKKDLNKVANEIIEKTKNEPSL